MNANKVDVCQPYNNMWVDECQPYKSENAFSQQSIKITFKSQLNNSLSYSHTITFQIPIKLSFKLLLFAKSYHLQIIIFLSVFFQTINRPFTSVFYQFCIISKYSSRSKNIMPRKSNIPKFFRF